MSAPHLVVIGLSLSSSWGNGHATTYRALLSGMHARGWRVSFLERDVPWYAANRDLPDPDFCELLLYDRVEALAREHAGLIGRADAVLVGSYVPGGPAAIEAALAAAGGPVAFYDIDTPVTLARLDRGDEEYLRRDQVPAFDVYFSFTGGPTLRRLERQYGARRAEALYCSVREELYRPVAMEPVWDLGYLGTYSDDRQPTLEALLVEPARRLPHRRFVVAGPQYPAGIDWPANVERIEHLPPAAHAAFYGRQRFTLNVTRADMIATGWSPSVRLFEAAACGTPIVSDRWDGLTDLLPEGEAVLIAGGADDVVRWLEEPAGRRRRVGETARRLILAGHTGRARAGELIAGLERARAARLATRTAAPGAAAAAAAGIDAAAGNRMTF